MNLVFPILYFLTGLFGLLMISILSFNYRTNKLLNLYFLFLILFISLRFISFGFFGISDKKETMNFLIMPFFSLIFPCVYLYFKNLVANKNKRQWSELVHFVFPILFGLVNLVLLNFITFPKQLRYLIFISIGIYYVYLSYILLKKELWNRKASINYIQKQNTLIKKWSIFFFIICLLLIVRVLITLVLDLYLGISSFAGRYIYIGLIICWVLYIKILTTPEILYGYNFFIEKVQEQRNIEFVLDEIWIFQKKRLITNNQDLELDKKISDKISLYISAIEIATLKNHQLREELVTLGIFANQLKLPKSHLVYLFKYHSKLSFVEFKKVVRIIDAVNLIETNYLNVNTLDSLARKVGFSSYNTFFTSFKEITGNTPRAISEEIKNKIEMKPTPA